MDKTCSLIDSIAGLWKLILCIAIPLILFWFRKPLSQMLPGLRKFKTVGAEVEMEPQKEHQQTSQSTDDQSNSNPTIPEAPQELVQADEDEDERDHLQKLIEAIASEDDFLASQILNDWDKEGPEQKKKHEVCYHAIRAIERHERSSAEKLQELTQDRTYESERFDVYRYLGKFYELEGSYSKASETFGEGEKQCSKQVDKAYLLSQRCKILVSTGSSEEALSELQNALSHYTDQDALSILYSQIAEVHRGLGNHFERCLALEKVLENNPRSGNFFSAAYSQSEAGVSLLALQNYSDQLAMKPDAPSARNNYAVLLGKLGLKAESVDNYSIARKNGETLAMANLAYLYLDKGLIGDAEEMLREAQKIEGYHGNVDSALAQISSTRDSEKEKLKEIKDWGPIFRVYFRTFGEAFFKHLEKPCSFFGSFELEDGQTVEVVQKGNFFFGEWGAKGSRRRIEGEQVNRAAKIRYAKEKWSVWSTENNPSYDTFAGAAYISDDGSELSVLVYEGDSPERFSLKRRKNTK